jgi:hypothetical protein
MLAQSLLEYGAMASLVSGARQAAYSIRDTVVTAPPETWLWVAGIALIGAWAWTRRPSGF